MSDNIDLMNVGITFVERNQSRDVARLERKQAMFASTSVCLLHLSFTSRLEKVKN